MEFYQLRYVLKAAKFLHFSKAAEELGITQPTLSQQIGKLEKELGVKLFERGTRSVELSLAGEEFIFYANKVLADFDQLDEAMQKHSVSKKKLIRIGTLSNIVRNIARLKLSKHLLRFQSIHPGIHLHVSEKSGSHELVKQLQQGNIDAAILFPPPNMALDSSMKCHTLLAGEVKVITRKDHPFANSGSVHLKDIAQENLIFPASTLSIYDVILGAFKTNGFNPRIISESIQIDTIIDWVAQGSGVSFVSSQIAETISHPDIAFLRLEPQIERNIAFAYPVTKANSPTLILFREFIFGTLESGKQIRRDGKRD